MTRWLVTGAGGQLGSLLLQRLTARGDAVVGTVSPAGSRPWRGHTAAIDLTDRDRVAGLLRAERPSCIVHAAGMTSVAAAQADPAAAHRLNVGLTEQLGELGEELGARLVYTSTDMVFGGEGAPYGEDSRPDALTVYGRTKHLGEQAVLPRRNTAVVRLPLLYGLPASTRWSFFGEQVRALRDAQPLTLFQDEWRTPLSLSDAADAVLRVADSQLCGLLHTGGPERMSRLEMGRALAQAMGVRDPQLRAVSRGSQSGADGRLESPPRPRDLSLRSARFEAHFGRPPGRPMGLALGEELSRAPSAEAAG